MTAPAEAGSLRPFNPAAGLDQSADSTLLVQKTAWPVLHSLKYRPSDRQKNEEAG